MDASLSSHYRSDLQEIAVLVDEIALELRDYLDEIEANPERLEAVQERLELIKQLKRKYGGSIGEILAYAEASQRELETLSGSEHDETAFRAALDELESSRAFRRRQRNSHTPAAPLPNS